MITIIQTYLKSKVMEITGLTTDQVFLSSQEETVYTSPPWVSILFGVGNVELINKLDKDFSNVNRMAKYRISYPIAVTIADEDSATLDEYIDNFLEGLAVYLVVDGNTDGQRVNLSVISDENFTAKAVVDNYTMRQLVLEAIYTVYVSEAEFLTQKVIIS